VRIREPPLVVLHDRRLQGVLRPSPVLRYSLETFGWRRRRGINAPSAVFEFNTLFAVVAIIILPLSQCALALLHGRERRRCR
jgi:hypothetical protein